MKNRETIPTTNEIAAEACAWVAQMESGDMSASDLSALREWMGRSPAHAREIRAVAALSGQLAEMTELAPMLEAAAGVHSGLRKAPRRARFAAPVFAAALAAIVAAGLLFALRPPAGDAAPDAYQTAIGEYETFVLADGTAVSLNTDSRIEVLYDRAERRIRMVRGEALFEVETDPARPFVVVSDTAVAEAIGTSFVVRLRNAVTELAVVEGVVAFSEVARAVTEPQPASHDASGADENALAAAAKVVVAAGQALTSRDISIVAAQDNPSALVMLSERDIQRKLSWTEGFLEFSQTPLEDVVAELTRHNDVMIEIADPSLKTLRFGGIFRTGDVDELMGALSGLGVAVDRQGENQYRLTAAEGP